MTANEPAWLPDRIMSIAGVLDEQYIELIYSHFREDFILSQPVYRNNKVYLVRYPEIESKHGAFWHIISNDYSLSERDIDIERASRIKWPRAILEHSSEIGMKIWKERTKSDVRIHIWFETKDFLVVLLKKKDRFLMVTAFPTNIQHKKKKLLKRYEEYKKAGDDH